MPSSSPLKGITRIDHFALHITSLERSAEFYRKVFGFEIIHKWTTTWMVGNGHARVGLFQRPEAQPVVDEDGALLIQHVAFLTTQEDFDKLGPQLEALEVPFEGPEDSGIAKSLFFDDPDGHSLEITYYYAT